MRGSRALTANLYGYIVWKLVENGMNSIPAFSISETVEESLGFSPRSGLLVTVCGPLTLLLKTTALLPESIFPTSMRWLKTHNLT